MIFSVKSGSDLGPEVMTVYRPLKKIIEIMFRK